jgi:hypothetical protein
MLERRTIIEFALLMIVLTVLGIVAKAVLPEAHQLLRFALVVVVTVALWLGARAALARYEGR